MSKHDGDSFSGSVEVMDGNVYNNCTFTNMVFVYKGGDIPVMKGCSINSCTIDFQDAAFRTLSTLSGVYSGVPGGKEFVEDVFDRIRKGE